MGARVKVPVWRREVQPDHTLASIVDAFKASMRASICGQPAGASTEGGGRDAERCSGAAHAAPPPPAAAPSAQPLAPTNSAALAASSVREALDRLGLGAYADTLVDTQGFDDLEFLRTCVSLERRREIGQQCGMKPGHAEKFAYMLS